MKLQHATINSKQLFYSYELIEDFFSKFLALNYSKYPENTHFNEFVVRLNIIVLAVKKLSMKTKLDIQKFILLDFTEIKE